MANGKITQGDSYESDLFKDLRDSAVKAQKIIDEFEGDISSLSESIKKLGLESVTDINKLAQAEVQLEKASQEVLKTRKLQAQAEAELIKIQRQEQALKGQQITNEIKLQKEQERQAKIVEKQAKEEEKLNSVYAKKSKRLNELRKQLKELTLTEGKNAKETKRLRKEVGKLDKELKDVDASAGQFQRNVGNYPETIKAATGNLLKMAAAAAGLKLSLDGIKGSLEASDEGADSLAEGTGFLEGAFTSLKSAAGGLLSNVINLARGKGGLGTLAAISKTLSREGLSDVIDKAFSTGDAFAKAAVDTRDLEKQILPLSQRVQELTEEISIQNAIAGDQTRSFNEIAAAAQKAQRAEIERAAILKDIATAELGIIETRLAAATEDQNILKLEIEATNKRIELSQLQNDLDLASIENSKILREVQQDRFERQLDFAIDAFDAQKTLSERQIADETRTFKERSKIFTDLKALQTDAFLSQKQLIDAQIGGQLDLDSLVNETSERTIRNLIAGVETSDVVKGRLLEFVRETKTVRQDLADAEKELREESKENAREAVEFINELEQTQFDGLIAALEDVEGKEGELLELRKAKLEAQAEFELSLEETTAEEKLVIKEKLANDLAALDREEEKRKEELRKEELEKEKEAAQKRIEQRIKTLEAIDSALETIDRAQEARLNRDIQRNDAALQAQQDRAKEGLDNELNFRREQAAKLEAIQERRAKREEKRDKILAYFKILGQKAEAGEKNPALAAAAEVAVAEFITGFFSEGTERVGSDGQAKKWRNTGKDDYLMATDLGERVLSSEQNDRLYKALGNIKNEDLVKWAEAHAKGQAQFIPVPQPQAVAPDIGKQIKEGISSIQVHVDIDRNGVVTQTELRDNMKKVIKHLRK